MGSKRKRQAQDVPAAAPVAKKHQKDPKPSSEDAAVLTVVATTFLEEPKGAELKREVQLYDQLGSQDELERLQAADAVVSGLLGGDGVSEMILQRHLERRLFRGIASGRKGARLGFSIALTEILAQLFGKKQLSTKKYPGLTFEKVLDILIAKTKPDGDLSGQEEKDHALGRLFGLQSFVRARILFHGEEDWWGVVLENLLQLAKKKPWMREECGWVIIENLEQMSQLQAEKTVEKVHEAGLAASPEGVGLWLEARRRFQDMRFPDKPWGRSGNPLDHLQNLAKAMKESSSHTGKDKVERVQQTGSWNAQLHFAWRILMSVYTENILNEIEGASSNFTNFWKVAVDENLFSSSASSERKFWGFLLFQKMLQDGKLYPEIISTIFSRNLVRCLINHVSKEDRFLHRAADKSLKIMLQTIEEEQATAALILPKLLSGSGVYNFDQVTKTKTIDKILAYVDDEQAVKVVHALLRPIMDIDTTDSVRDAEARRQMFGDYLLSIIRHLHVTNKMEQLSWIKNGVLDTMATVAYGKSEDGFQPPLSEKTRTIFRNRLTSAFAHLITAHDGFLYPCELLQAFDPSAVDMDKDISMAKDRALAVMEKLINKAKKSPDTEKKPLQALALLYALVIFQLYNGEADAISLLNELNLCYDTLVRKKDVDDMASEPSVVLIEILLSFMSKSSALLRKIAQQVFTAFSGEVTAEGLKALTDVLESSESIKGQQELFDEDNSHGEGEGENESEDELDSDVEIVDLNGSRDNPDPNDSVIKEEEETTENDEDDEDLEDDEEGDDEAQKLDDALAAALGTHRADQDLNEAYSDSDADMSDSEMMALDSKLVEIFSQRKNQPNKKQEKKDARENIINFKTRVLDLLEIYVKERPTNPLAFDLLIPLLKLTRTTTAKHLGEKAHKIISTFARALKKVDLYEDEIDFDVSERLTTLALIHGEASRDPSHAFSKAASTASLLVASSLYRSSKDNLKRIMKAYMLTQTCWVEGKWKMQASFFHEWVNWCQSHVP